MFNCGKDSLNTEFVFRGFEQVRLEEQVIMAGDDLLAANSFENPNRI